MEFEEIAKEAYKKNGPNKLWDLPKKYAYYQLEDLYYRYKLGNINEKDSIIEKRKINKEYEWNKEEYNKSLNVYKEYNKNRAKNTLLLAEIEKSKDKDKIIKLALEIIANCISDNSFVERILFKIQNIN